MIDFNSLLNKSYDLCLPLFIAALMSLGVQGIFKDDLILQLVYSESYVIAGIGWAAWALGTAFIGVILFFVFDMLVIWIHVECGDQLVMGLTGIMLMAIGLLSVYGLPADIPFTDLNQLWAAALFSYGCTLLHREQIACRDAKE